MVELTPDQVNKLYDLIDKSAPENVTTEEITRVIIELENKITPYFSDEDHEENFTNNKNILIVDDLELSVFQLSKLLMKSGYETFVARSYEEAYDFYKKQSFDFVLLDLFLPEPDDGLKLLESFMKFEKTKINNTKIVVISGSDDKDLINQCFVKGADDFIGKARDWHRHVLRRIRKFDEIKQGATPDIVTKVEDDSRKIASVRISNFAKPEAKDDLKREILSLTNMGYSNLILDFENVHTIDTNDINLMIMAFKLCRNNNGELKLSSINTLINESLSYVFLDGVIPVYNSIDSALGDFNYNGSSDKSTKSDVLK